MVQPNWFYYPPGQPQPYQLSPAGDVQARGRPPLGASCVDANTVTVMNGLTDYAVGSSGYKVMSGVVDAALVSGMFVAPYAYTTSATFVKNPSASPPGSPSYYLRLQQLVTNNSAAESLPFGLWLNLNVPYSFSSTKSSAAACTNDNPCNSSTLPFLAAGSYPNANFTSGTAVAISPKSYWSGVASAYFTNDSVNQRRAVSLPNSVWSIAPKTSRSWEWYVLVGDWTNALNFSTRPTVWGVPTPRTGPLAGGTQVTITGSKFATGASVTVGGVSATGVVVQSAVSLKATTPAGIAGAADVKVTNADATNVTFTRGYVYDFTDVPPNDSGGFHEAVAQLARSGITAGCGNNQFCVGTSITRAQMSVFLLKAEHGSSYVPPACTRPPNQVFADVTCPSQFADWIQRLYVEGVTSGCGGANFCPNSTVTRGQMAVFLGKARWGASFVPLAATGCVFSDVATTDQFADWIEVVNFAGAMGTTYVSPPPPASPFCSTGCSTTCPFSPGLAVTRGKMAQFMALMFNLQ
jgi:hypothetical protein